MASTEYSPRIMRDTFLATLAAIRPIVASPEVAAHWNDLSVLPEWTVRGLAGHLVRTGLVVDMYLDRPSPTDAEPISPAGYFSQVTSDINTGANVAIRQRGEEHAADGQAQLVHTLDDLIARLEERLSREPQERLVRVAGDAGMRLDDYLVTRLIELTVHADDLALSVGLETPALPSEALELVIHALVDIARYQQDDLTVLRALSRRERQSADILCVF
jgi:mycothiol maleylpyruvate isomerase-like protein